MATTPPFEPNTLSVIHRIGQPPSCEFETNDGDQTVTVATGQALTLDVGSERIFSGTIDEVDILAEPGTLRSGTPLRRYRLRATGYQEIANRRTTGRVEWITTFSQPYTISDVATYLAGLLSGDGITANIPGVLATLTIDRFSVSDESIAQALDRLAAYATSLSISQIFWFIDPQKVLQFYPIDLQPALPLVGQPYGYEVSTAHPFSCRTTREQYANRILLKLDKYLRDQATESFTADGSTTSFQLAYPCAGAPLITVDGASQNVGIDGLDTGADWYWNTGSREIRQEPSASPVANGGIVSVTYIAQDLRIVSAENTTQIATYGVHEAFVGVQDSANAARAAAIASYELSRRDSFSVVLNCVVNAPMGTYEAGFLVPVDIPGLVTGYFLCRSVRFFDQDGVTLWTQLELIAGPIVFSGVEYFRRLAA